MENGPLKVDPNALAAKGGGSSSGLPHQQHAQQAVFRISLLSDELMFKDARRTYLQVATFHTQSTSRHALTTTVNVVFSEFRGPRERS